MQQELVSPGTLIFTATLLASISGTPMLFRRFLSASCAQQLAAIIMLAASAAGLSGAMLTVLRGTSELYQLVMELPFGRCEAGVDPLTAWFLLPIFLIPGLASLYACAYWRADDYPYSVRKMTIFLGLMTGFMSAVTLARDGVSFLVVWEVMALAAFFLVATEDEKPEVNSAATLYLITAHIGTLALFALFPLLALAGGSWLFPQAASLDASSPLASIIFLTALFGFGVKAGVMPLHVWLPSAHASAPSHVSAVMSGVILKVGVYGILRTLTFFHDFPLWWGTLLLMSGVVSGVFGVVFAIGQHNLKRLLAYHSIENIGIIFIGLGVALIGLSTGSPAIFILGASGALLHVLNHATFKALLFLGAGSVIHATGTRSIDLMGGVARRLPYTALFFGVGAVAICGLPPLNGFVSEFLIYLGLFRGIQGGGVAAAANALAAPALALIGGLAAACFVKVYGVIFLGLPRSEEHRANHEAGWQMLVPMGVLAVVCITVGLAPSLPGELLNGVVLSAFPSVAEIGTTTLSSLVPFPTLSITAAILLIMILLLTFWYRRKVAAAPERESETWGCGYQRPTARIQYTASSFADLLTGLFTFFLKPRIQRPELSTSKFPEASSFHKYVPETTLEHLYIPALERLYQRVLPIRRMQNGILQQYVLYILLTLVLLFASDYIR